MHNPPVNNTDNKTTLTEGLAQIFITSKYDTELAVFCFRYFIEGTEEKVSGPALIKFTDALNDLITPEKAQETIELLWKLRTICINDSELKEFAVNLYNRYIELQATRDAYNDALGENPKSFVDRVAPQHATTPENQSHVDRLANQNNQQNPNAAGWWCNIL